MALAFFVCAVAQGAFSGTLKPHVSKKYSRTDFHTFGYIWSDVTRFGTPKQLERAASTADPKPAWHRARFQARSSRMSQKNIAERIYIHSAIFGLSDTT